MKNNILIIFTITTISLFSVGCNSSDDSVTEPNDSINFESALLKTFPLSEIDSNLADNISIKQPTMINGLPQNKGEITIQLAYTEISKFSLKEVDFNSSDFSISPSIGEQSIIPGKTITYTITSSKDSSTSLQYDVLVTVKKLEPGREKLALNSFSFLQTNNTDFSEDITSVEIRKHSNSVGNYSTIVMIVPQETKFSSLVPTIDFEGSSITYNTNVDGNDSDFKEFTEGGSLDFKFPNIIVLRVNNSDRSKFLEYRVFVDVKNPIVFDDNHPPLDDTTVNGGPQQFDNVVGFTNYGNYPITTNIFASEIKVIATPEATAKNYYTAILLKEDNSSDSDDHIQTGEKGKLRAEINFPFSFTGSTVGFDVYSIEADFSELILHAYGTPDIRKDINSGPLEELEFHIYDPVKIKISASVLVTTP